jgi:hypothetical protein
MFYICEERKKGDIVIFVGKVLSLRHTFLEVSVVSPNLKIPSFG